MIKRDRRFPAEIAGPGENSRNLHRGIIVNDAMVLGDAGNLRGRVLWVEPAMLRF
jgi:hypothetical protein